MTDYSALVQSNIVASVIQSDEMAFEEVVAKAVRSSDNLNLAAAKVEMYVTDVIWDVLNGLEDYEPIAYSLAYEGKLSLDYDGYGDDLYNVVKAYAAKHAPKSNAPKGSGAGRGKQKSKCGATQKPRSNAPKGKTPAKKQPKKAAGKGRR